MNRTALYNDVAREFGYPDVSASPAAAITNRIYDYLNKRHRRLLTVPGTAQLRREATTLTLTASTAEYTLAMPIQKIEHVRDTTNDRTIYERDLQWYRRVDPDPVTGTQEFWIPLRVGPALASVGTAGLWAVSTSASDTQAATVETLNSAGSHTQANVTLTGTTRVQVGSDTTHERVLRFAVTSAGAGVISLYNASTGGTEVSRINIGRTQAQFQVIAFWPTPAAADTIAIDYIHHIRDFANAYDEPQLPEDFHYLVALGAKIDEGRKREDLKRVQGWEHEYATGVRELIHWLSTSGDTVIVPGELDATGRSNLGPAFPAGIWEG